ncbi:MAG: adenylate/guanylate cyclase domain-containing protein, partial [Curvibacter sp.]
VTIWSPVTFAKDAAPALIDEIKLWAQTLKAYRAQNWDQADVGLLNLSRLNANKFLSRLYAERIASMRFLPFDESWDGATNFDTK